MTFWPLLFERWIMLSNGHKTKEELRFTFTPSGRREFVPRDQVFPLFSIYSLLPIHKKYTVLCQF